MRVAMVSEHASPLSVLGDEDAGGQNVHVASLSAALARRGVSVTVYTRRESPDVPCRVDLAAGVEVVQIDAGPARKIPKDQLLPHMGRFAVHLRQELASLRPDVVHAHFWMSGLATSAAVRRLAIPVVQTFHALGSVKRRYQGAADTSPPQRIEIERRLLRAVDLVIATCSEEAFELSRMAPAPAPVAVVPCGVDLDQFCPHGPTARRRPGVHRLVTLSRLVERKGIGDVIRILPMLPDTELIVAGGLARERLFADAEARRLRRLAAVAGVDDRVEFLGGIERCAVPALLRSADAVVCVPWYEPFGIVPLEAMACGVPVVAASVGGLVDTVVDGVTGVHVRPGSAAHLCRALRRLLTDARLRKALGAAGVVRARDHYGWDTVADRTLRAYTAAGQAARPPLAAGSVQ